MNEVYILKHKNVDAAIIEFNSISDTANYIKIKEPEYTSFMKDMSVEEFNLWWKFRAIPDSRVGIKDILTQNGCDTSLSLLKKNLGLSLTDTFWICPIGIDLKWEDVSLFSHVDKKVSFKSITDVDIINNPNASLSGNLRKYADFVDGRWKLYKYGETSDFQQSINEKFASLINERQGFDKYVKYITEKINNEVVSICDFFTSEDIEMVSGFEIMYSVKKDNDTSDFEHYINLCKRNGLDDLSIREFMDYQTLLDFVITNKDRHYRNFGLLRNANSMEFISAVPIFDNGNSMFYDKSIELSRIEILEIPISSFYKSEEKLLTNISNKNLLKLDLLPEPKEVFDYYVDNGISEARAKIISLNYSHKLDLLLEFQKGRKISLYNEKSNKDAIEERYYNKAVKELETMKLF